jgi:hypothetical protein
MYSLLTHHRFLKPLSASAKKAVEKSLLAAQESVKQVKPRIGSLIG